MRSGYLVLGLALAGCGYFDVLKRDDDTAVSAATNTDTDTVVTGCYDVPIDLVGGYGAFNTTFSALADGDHVPFTHVPDGGWIIETALQLDHVNAAVQVLPSVTLVSSGQVISGARGCEDRNVASVWLAMTGGCSGGYNGLRAYLDDVAPPGILETPAEICALAGQELEIEWAVTDLVDGRTATTSVRVIADMDPEDLDPGPYVLHPNCTDY